MLLRSLRHMVERGHVSHEECANVVRAQLSRPGGPAHGLPRETKERLARAIDTFAAQMETPPAPRSLLALARASAEAALGLVVPPRHPGVRVAQRTETPAQLAQAALFAEAPHAKDGEDLVRRAVTRAVREKKRKGSVVNVDVAEGDPMRALLDLPAHGRVFLPRNDVRVRIVDMARSSPLGAMLQDAARFAEPLVRPALGEELWELARPVGLSTKSKRDPQSVVVVEVSSSVAANEVHLRKREILERLKSIKGLERIKDVEIVVKSATVLPVVGGLLGDRARR